MFQKHPDKMASSESITLKDVDQHKFVQAFASFLKKYVLFTSMPIYSVFRMIFKFHVFSLQNRQSRSARMDWSCKECQIQGISPVWPRLAVYKVRCYLETHLFPSTRWRWYHHKDFRRLVHHELVTCYRVQKKFLESGMQLVDILAFTCLHLL